MAASTRHADAIVAALVVLAFVEYLVRPLELTPVPTNPPPTYEWLSRQPEGVVAEFPMPTKLTAPLYEGQFQYLSTFHWRPMVNGYSGSWSERHVRFLSRTSSFPDADSVAALRASGVTYGLIHERYYGRDRYREVLDRIRSLTDVQEAGRFPDNGFEVAVYRFVTVASDDPSTNVDPR